MNTGYYWKNSETATKLQDATQLIENLSGALKNLVCRHSWAHEDSSCNCDEFFQAKKTLTEVSEWKKKEGV